MVHSNWGTWFVNDEIEAVEPFGLTMWYIGGTGFVLRTPETTVYVDPYFGDGDPPNIVRMLPVPLDPADATECDAVLVTHEHLDHMHPPSYRPFVDDLGADVYATEACYDSPQYDGEIGVPDEKKHVVASGDSVRIDDLVVHVRGANDPAAIDEVSYVIEHESGTFFNGGDSRPDSEGFPAIADEFDIDAGALALGSVGNVSAPGGTEIERTRWYMDENQLIEAANQLELERLLPVHHDLWRGVGANPAVLGEHAASFEFPRTIESVSLGDRFDVDSPGRVQSRAIRR
ncbi:MBL fold metallo-hydrolase [Natrarchaeobius halalkaliphilus]|uniref:MBL fold metallo-hydrolase n=1 Tax=Natrarchaeobius halalkaliphilus TaxID=1679091 RepID=A0A3N6M011_9EURY|nr:MBL fold metallo-hydrolase [Natrarchaeobius halalkaliphilus]RQG87844.1 MBL fold metallo-hydrolase [Natrarchaeobius halalkaliphilus]